MEQRVLMLLSPLPSGVTVAAGAVTAGGAAASAHADHDDEPPRRVKPQPKAKAKAKAKAKTSSRTIDKSDTKGCRALPKGLVGSSRNAAGESFCFGYNTQGIGCADAVPGAKCAKGWHTCVVCGSAHGVFDCKKNHQL